MWVCASACQVEKYYTYVKWSNNNTINKRECDRQRFMHILPLYMALMIFISFIISLYGRYVHVHKLFDEETTERIWTDLILRHKHIAVDYYTPTHSHEPYTANCRHHWTRKYPSRTKSTVFFKLGSATGQRQLSSTEIHVNEGLVGQL